MTKTMSMLVEMVWVGGGDSEGSSAVAGSGGERDGGRQSGSELKRRRAKCRIRAQASGGKQERQMKQGWRGNSRKRTVRGSC